MTRTMKELRMCSMATAAKASPFNLYQLNENSDPVAHLGKATTDHFRVHVNRHSPFGRGLLKIEIEAKPLSQL